jgi:probable F420-dependent oxidoreductase
MKMGIVTPIVHMNPRFEAPEWETNGTIDDVVAVVEAADRFGVDWVTASEHIAIPENASNVRGGRYWDPISTLSFIAAKTERVNLLPHMVVIPYHHPLEIVKRFGTLDLVSNGRLILGVGVGSLQPEFEVLGHQFDGRGDRSDDAIRAIRSSWGVRVPTYQGTHYSFSGFIVDPSGLPREINVWVGGRTKRSLRRALELGHAWMPFGLNLDELREILSDERIRELMDQREDHLELVFPPEPPVDPTGDRAGTLAVFRAFQEAGATGLSLRLKNDSRSHFIEQMQAAVELMKEVDS